MRYFTSHVQDQMESSLGCAQAALNHAIYYINQNAA